MGIAVTAPTASAESADGRHYELMSTGVAPGSEPALMRPDVSTTASMAFFVTSQPQADSPNGASDYTHVARRSSRGWTSSPVGLPASNGAADSTVPPESKTSLIPPDSDRILVTAFGHQDPLVTNINPLKLHLYETVVGSSSGRLVLPPPFQDETFTPVAGQSSLTSFFTDIDGSSNVILPDGTPVSPPALLRVDQKGVTAASRLPSGALMDPTWQPVVASDVGLYSFTYDNIKRAGVGRQAISMDGRRMFFTAFARNPDVPGTEGSDAGMELGLNPIYLRDDDRTVTVTKSRVDGSDKAGRFIGASPNGNLAYFISNVSLDPGHNGAGVYRYDVTEDSLTRLTPSKPQANIDDLLIRTAKTSRDGSTVYFVSAADFGLGGQQGARNAYVWRNGDLRFIGNLGSDGEVAVVSRDGAFAAFTSSNVPSVPGADTGGNTQFFHYSYEIDSLACASCRGDGTANAAAIVPDYNGARYIADNGSLFFTSLDRLMPADLGGGRDVYEFTNGGLRLISDGRGNSRYTDNSDDGRSVYLLTASSLVPEDDDGGTRDLYVRRAGPDIDRQPVAAPCASDACQGIPSRLPAAPAVSSQRAGTDDRATRRTVVAEVLGRPSLAPSASRRLARGYSATVRVRVRGRGTLTVRGTTTIRSQRELATQAAKTGRKESSRLIGVRLKLNARAMRQLRRNGRARLRLTARYGRDDSRPTSVLLKVER